MLVEKLEFLADIDNMTSSKLLADVSIDDLLHLDTAGLFSNEIAVILTSQATMDELSITENIQITVI